MVNVYPNPADETIWLETNEEINSLSIVNLQGQNVASFDNEARKLDVSHLPSGVYVLQVEIENTTYQKRLIVE